MAKVAKLMNDAGLILLTSFISPSQKDRELAQHIIGKDNFFEIFMTMPIEICEKRDPKGMYKKARLGEIKNFTGISANYDIPNSPFMRVDISTLRVSEAVERLISSMAIVASKEFMYE